MIQARRDLCFPPTSHQPSKDKSQTPMRSATLHDAPPPHGKCCPPLTCHPPARCGVYGDGWRSRSTLKVKSLVHSSAEKAGPNVFAPHMIGTQFITNPQKQLYVPEQVHHPLVNTQTCTPFQCAAPCNFQCKLATSTRVFPRQ